MGDNPTDLDKGFRVMPLSEAAKKELLATYGMNEAERLTYWRSRTDFKSAARMSRDVADRIRHLPEMREIVEAIDKLVLEEEGGV